MAKTAEFNGGRRIVAGWIASRSDGRDSGGEVFGGSVVLRETYQLPDGELATRFPAEVIPAAEQAQPASLTADRQATVDGRRVGSPFTTNSFAIADGIATTVQTTRDATLHNQPCYLINGQPADPAQHHARRQVYVSKNHKTLR